MEQRPARESVVHRGWQAYGVIDRVHDKGKGEEMSEKAYKKDTLGYQLDKLPWGIRELAFEDAAFPLDDPGYSLTSCIWSFCIWETSKMGSDFWRAVAGDAQYHEYNRLSW